MKIKYQTIIFTLVMLLVLSMCKNNTYTHTTANSDVKTNKTSECGEIVQQDPPAIHYRIQLMDDTIEVHTNCDNIISMTINVAGVIISKTIHKPYRINILTDVMSLSEENKYELALYATKNNNILPLHINIVNALDTIIDFHFKPLRFDDAKTCIVGKCAPLILKSSDTNLIPDTKRWLFRKKEHLTDSLVMNMVNLLRKMGSNEFEDYITNSSIPVVNSLPCEKYKVSSNMIADHYVLFAFESQNEVDKFVEDIVSDNFKLTTETLTNPLTCYGETNGCKCIALIGINDNWSYDVMPLGLVVIDNIAPKTRAIDYSSNSGTFDMLYGYNSYGYNTNDLNNDIKNLLDNDNSDIQNKKTITISDNRRINMENIPEIDGNVTIQAVNMDGNGIKCSITFVISYSGDAKSVTIVREYATGEYESYYPKPERKTILLKDSQSKIKIVYDYHLTDGDNLIPLIVEDNHGNKKQIEINVPVNFEYRGGNGINIDIENNINNSIYNY